MTAPMAIPSVRAQKRRDTSPKADFRTPHDRELSPFGHGVEFARKATKTNNSAASAAEIDPSKPLTTKQKQFVEAWAKGDSIPNACLRAGYSDDGLGYRLARMPNILAYKAKFERQYEAAAQMSRQKVMEGFKESIEMAKLMAEPMTMIAGWREIGKLCGYYAPVETRVKVDVSGNVTMNQLTQMTDAELLEMIEKGKNPVPQLEMVEDVTESN